jgi:hypothetical protein
LKIARAVIVRNKSDGKENIGKNPNIRSAVVRSGDFGLCVVLSYEFAIDDVVCTVIIEADTCLHAFDNDYDCFVFRVNHTDFTTLKISNVLHFGTSFLLIL